jgi:hypothetical protein
MDQDVRGAWTGMEYTDGLIHAQGLVGGGEGWGGPPKTYSVVLTIATQSPYRDFSGGTWVSAVTGEMSRQEGGYFVGLIPVAGFVDRAGQVKLSFHSGTLAYRYKRCAEPVSHYC